jgi:DNA-binding response OmpR family regulator
MSPKKIILVEDEPSLSQLLTQKLEEAGFTVLQANDGEQGMKMIEQEKPDLVLLDIILPKKDGLVMLEEMRNTSWGHDVPVILLTNLRPDDDINEHIARYNPVFYLEKAQYPLMDVVGKVKEFLKMG